MKYFYNVILLAFCCCCCCFYFDSLAFLIFFVLVLIEHARVDVLCWCVCGIWSTQIIIDKSPKYGCHFSLVPMVICENLYSSTFLLIYFVHHYCILLGTNKVVVVVVVALARVELWQHVRVKLYWRLSLLCKFDFSMQAKCFRMQKI